MPALLTIDQCAAMPRYLIYFTRGGQRLPHCSIEAPDDCEAIGFAAQKLHDGCGARPQTLEAMHWDDAADQQRAAAEQQDRQLEQTAAWLNDLGPGQPMSGPTRLPAYRRIDVANRSTAR